MYPKKYSSLPHIQGSPHFTFYNFGRIHQSLRVTPAMEAGLTDHVWTLEEFAALSDKPIQIQKMDEKVTEISN